MKKTLIISSFAGCGKTWLASHQKEFGYTISDSDSSTYDKTPGWEKRYIAHIMEKVNSGKYDFIFVCQTESVLTEMDAQGIKYVIVEPYNIVWDDNESAKSAENRLLIKQQWMGRLVLRENTHITDFTKWFDHIKEIYDDRTSLDFINRHKPVTFFSLEQNQYLVDVIKDLYWKKENYPKIYCCNKAYVKF